MPRAQEPTPDFMNHYTVENAMRQRRRLTLARFLALALQPAADARATTAAPDNG